MKMLLCLYLLIAALNSDTSSAERDLCDELPGIWIGLADTQKNWRDEDNFTQFFLRVIKKRGVVRVWTVEGNDIHLLEYAEVRAFRNQCTFLKPSRKNKYAGPLTFRRQGTSGLFIVEPAIYSPMTKGVFKTETPIEGVPRNLVDLPD